MKKISFGKILLIFFFVNSIALELFTAYVTLVSLQMAINIGTFPDFTPLITLLGEVIGQAIAYAIYCAKATKENTSGGIIFEQDMQKKEEKTDADYNG